MDEVRNPYAPGAGTKPPMMAGRDEIFKIADINLQRVLLGNTAQGILLTGLRGVGKTVLLNKLNDKAEELGYYADFMEASDNKSIASMLIPSLRKAAIRFNMTEKLKELSTKVLRILKSFSIAMKLGDADFSIGVDPLAGSADSGDVANDLIDVFKTVGLLAKEAHSGVAIFIDEIQYLSSKDYAALIVAMHRIAQLQLPITIMGAGLPMLPALSGETKSYAERLFMFPRIGALLRDDAIKAIVEPALTHGRVEYDGKAIDKIIELTQCYPYFLQEWGFAVWNSAPCSPITLDDVNKAYPVVLRKLDDSFFRVRLERATESEKIFLRALAELGHGAHSSKEVTNILKKQASSVSTIRDGLIKKGLIYAPKHGYIEFTVPLFDDFMCRTIAKANLEEPL